MDNFQEATAAPRRRSKPLYPHFRRKRHNICVTTDSGEYLFTLDDNNSKITTITAKEAYRKKYQWFEPDADDYLKLLAVSRDFITTTAVKHVSWEEVARFSLIHRYSISYRSGGSGDWKASPQGGDGYLLVDIDGAPYWADAIGQIPFAVNTTKNLMLEDFKREHKKFSNGDYGPSAFWPGAGWINSGVFNKVLAVARSHSSGNVLPGGGAKEGNNYDIFMVARGAKWALKKHEMIARYSSFWGDYEYSIMELPNPPASALSQSVGLNYP